jgi:hypothetical protein
LRKTLRSTVIVGVVLILAALYGIALGTNLIAR